MYFSDKWTGRGKPSQNKAPPKKKKHQWMIISGSVDGFDITLLSVAIFLLVFSFVGSGSGILFFVSLFMMFGYGYALIPDSNERDIQTFED